MADPRTSLGTKSVFGRMSEPVCFVCGAGLDYLAPPLAAALSACFFPPFGVHKGTFRKYAKNKGSVKAREAHVKRSVGAV